jgi:hypothetical protein
MGCVVQPADTLPGSEPLTYHIQIGNFTIAAPAHVSAHACTDIPVQMGRVQSCERHANRTHINGRSIYWKKPRLTRRVIANCKQWNWIVAGEFRGVSCVASLHQSVAHLGEERGKTRGQESGLKQRPQRFLVATTIIILVHTREERGENLQHREELLQVRTK